MVKSDLGFQSDLRLIYQFIYSFYRFVIEFRLPFDWKSPTGYVIAILLQFIIVFYECSYLACFLTLALGIYLFILSFAKDMIDELQTINDRVKMENSIAQIRNQLNEFITMQSDIKELSYKHLKIREMIDEFIENSFPA